MPIYDAVIIKRGGVLKEFALDLNKELDNYVSPLRSLFYKCVLEKGVVLRDILNIVAQIGSTGIFTTDESNRIDKFRKVKSKKYDTFDHLKIHWQITIYKDKTMCFDSPMFSVVGKDKDIYSIEFSDPSKIIDKEVILSNEVTVFDYSEKDRNANDSWEKCVKKYTTDSFTLGAVLNAVVHELAYHSDEYKENLKKMLTQRIEDSKNDPGISTKELMKRLKKKFKKKND